MLGFIVFIGYLIYKIVRFFLSPEGIQGILELLKALGLCLGVILLILLVVVIYYRIIPPKKPAKLSQMSKDYPIRCDRCEIDTRDNPEALPDPSGQSYSTPIYLSLSITNYGLYLSPIPPQYGWEGLPPDNTERYRLLSIDRPGSIILPTGFFNLYYILYHQSGDSKIESYPFGQPGNYGVLPPELGGNLVEIIIANSQIVDPANLSIYISREKPIMLRLVSLDQNGGEDTVATCELYEAIYSYMHPPDTSYEDYYGY